MRELQDIDDAYTNIFEFEEGDVKPTRASGTRWISHKLEALKLLLDKYGIFIQHFHNMCAGETYKADDRAKFKGWLRKWGCARYPLLASLFIELLNHVSCVSKGGHRCSKCCSGN